MRPETRNATLAATLLLVAAACLSCGRRGAGPPASGQTPVGRPPLIRPDYAGVVIPPNIAPLNFVVQEPGVRFAVTIRGAEGAPIEIVSSAPEIRIPRRRWQDLLGDNRPGDLTFEVSAASEEGTWRRFEPFSVTVAEHPIDAYLAYRFIPSVHNSWKEIAVRQRHLPSFRDSVVLRNRSFGEGCLNCHSFLNNRTARMTLGIRSRTYGSSCLLVNGGRAQKLGTKFGYTSWHPSGRVVAYSLNKVRQYFHSGGVEVRDVVDLESALAYYDLASQTVKTHPAFSDPDRLETYPTWSPDGKQLYFCSAPVLWSDRNAVPPENYTDCRYDLKRIAYDVDADEWGEPETVLSAEETGKSILLPRVSPDGRFVLFCMCDYGCFPIYQPSSDLYLMELESGAYRRLDINSDRSESWHSWSSNSRWIAFSSKRRDGLYTRTYFGYVDAEGNVHKPFILPQEDPALYDTLLKTYTLPELIAEPVQVTPRRLAAAVRSTRKIEVDVPVKFTPAKKGAEGEAQAYPWRPAR